MDEPKYLRLADETFRRLEDLFVDVDAEDVDVERSGDTLALVFKGGGKCVINTQRPTRQIWLAASARAWHFSWDEGTERWMDDKGQGVELFSQIRDIVRDAAGIALGKIE
jgi:CyaY protein